MPEAERPAALSKLLVYGRNPTTNKQIVDKKQALYLPASIKSAADIQNPELKEKVTSAGFLYVKEIKRTKYGLIRKSLRDLGVNTSKIAAISFISFNIMELMVYGDKSDMIQKLSLMPGVKCLPDFNPLQPHHEDISGAEVFKAAGCR
ncbi:hypothetical protein HK098_000281, partial [Nowakowskiella sp. JEL0407]